MFRWVAPSFFGTLKAVLGQCCVYAVALDAFLADFNRRTTNCGHTRTWAA